jgi:hypothetical protein
MKRWAIVLVVLVVLSYALFEARKLIAGPEITILYPEDGSATSSPVVTIAGVARNISFLTINDAPAYTDEDGRFVERFSPPPGYTSMVVAATDRFGRTVSETVSIAVLTYCPIS